MNSFLAYNLWDSPNETTDFWELLTNEQRAVLESVKEMLSVSKGSSFFRQGDEPERLFYVRRGTVKVTRMGGAGRKQILRFVTQGELFGYGAAFSDGSYVASAEAFEECVIWAFPINSMRHIMLQTPLLARYAVQRLARELGEADCRLVSLTQSHLRGRMAETLLFLNRAHVMGKKETETLPPLARKELASLSNMSTSNAIRTLAQLAEEGLIEVDGRNIRILNPERLHWLALQG